MGKFQSGQTIEYSIESGLEPGNAIVETIFPRVNSEDDTFTVVAIMDVSKLDLPLGSSVYVTYKLSESWDLIALTYCLSL